MTPRTNQNLTAHGLCHTEKNIALAALAPYLFVPSQRLKLRTRLLLYPTTLCTTTPNGNSRNRVAAFGIIPLAAPPSDSSSLIRAQRDAAVCVILKPYIAPGVETKVVKAFISEDGRGAPLVV